MALGVSIRHAAKDDADAIAELHAESWRSAYRGAYNDAYLDGQVFDDRRAVWRERMASPAANQLVLLAVESDEVLGFVCAYGSHEDQWGTLIDNLHVRPDLKRSGIGRMLMRACAEWCIERYPDAPVHLWVLEQNANARAFYGRLGGKPVEAQESIAASGDTVVGWRMAWASPGALLDA